MTKVLVLGATGMLGQMVRQVLSESREIDVKSTSYEHNPNSFSFNAEEGIEGLRQNLKNNAPFDYFINCIGILSNKIDAQDFRSVRRAILVNALFPHQLAALAQETGSRVIQISTDGVFSKRSKICFEDSPSDPCDIYGKTKSLGEVTAPHFLNIRCSIIGPNITRKEGLLEWLCAQAPNAAINGYKNHLWNGVTTLQFAQLCRALILNNFFDTVYAESPTHHFCPNKSITKYELLRLLKRYFRPDISIKPVASKEGAIHRILDTRYRSLKDLFGYKKSMQSAIAELAKKTQERD